MIYMFYRKITKDEVKKVLKCGKNCEDCISEECHKKMKKMFMIAVKGNIVPEFSHFIDNA